MRYISEGAGNDSALIDIFLKKKIKTKIIKEKLFQKENLNFNSFFKKILLVRKRRLFILF